MNELIGFLRAITTALLIIGMLGLAIGNLVLGIYGSYIQRRDKKR